MRSVCAALRLCEQRDTLTKFVVVHNLATEDEAKAKSRDELAVLAGRCVAGSRRSDTARCGVLGIWSGS